MERVKERGPSMISQIFTMWCCGKSSCPNFQKYCFIDETNDEHLHLDSSDACAWERAISKGDATLDAPPATVLSTLVKKNARKNPAAAAVNSKENAASPVIHAHVHMAPQPPPPYTPFADSGLPPTDAHATANPQYSSSARAGLRSSPVEPDADASGEMVDYIDYLIRMNPGHRDGLAAAKEKIAGEDLDIGQVRSMPDSVLAGLGIPLGVRMILQGAVKDFKTRSRDE